MKIISSIHIIFGIFLFFNIDTFAQPYTYYTLEEAYEKIDLDPFSAVVDGKILTASNQKQESVFATFDHKKHSLVISKLTATGHIDWVKRIEKATTYDGNERLHFADIRLEAVHIRRDEALPSSTICLLDDGSIFIGFMAYPIPHVSKHPVTPYNQTFAHFYLLKLDKHGHLLWTKAYLSSSDFSITNILIAPNETLYLTGITRVTNCGTKVFVNALLDQKAGNIIWTHIIQGFTGPSNAVVAIDGKGFVNIGYVKNDNSQYVYRNGIIFYIDMEGTLMWIKMLDHFYPMQIKTDSLEQYWLLGRVDQGPNNVLARFDASMGYLDAWKIPTIPSNRSKLQIQDLIIERNQVNLFYKLDDVSIYPHKSSLLVFQFDTHSGQFIDIHPYYIPFSLGGFDHFFRLLKWGNTQQLGLLTYSGLLHIKEHESMPDSLPQFTFTRNLYPYPSDQEIIINTKMVKSVANDLMTISDCALLGRIDDSSPFRFQESDQKQLRAWIFHPVSTEIEESRGCKVIFLDIGSMDFTVKPLDFKEHSITIE